MKKIKNFLILFGFIVIFESCDITTKEEIIQDPQNCDVVIDHIGYNLDLKNMTAEVAAISATGAVTIPSSINASGKDFTVITVGAYAAQNNQRLISVKLPSTVSIIKKLAFNNCKSLTRVDFGEGVESIQSEAFEFSGLKSLVIPPNINKIADDAFLYCNAIETLTIEESENALDWNLKIGEDGLDKYSLSSIIIGRNVRAVRTFPSKSIKIGKTVTNVGYFPVPAPTTIDLLTLIPPEASIVANNNVLMESVINVPEEALEVYKNDPNWGKFWNIKMLSSDQKQ